MSNLTGWKPNPYERSKTWSSDTSDIRPQTVIPIDGLPVGLRVALQDMQTKLDRIIELLEKLDSNPEDQS